MSTLSGELEMESQKKHTLHIFYMISIAERIFLFVFYFLNWMP